MEQTSKSYLRSEHLQLEGWYEALLTAYRFGDWADVAAEWSILEDALRAHMAREETLIFSGAFRSANPGEAEALTAEHDALRAIFDTLGVAIELHAVPLADAEALVARLREHGRREEGLLYPWLDEALGRETPARVACAR